MSTSRHPTEQWLMTTCHLVDDEQVRRLGIFFAAHTVMDTHLISRLVDHEFGKIGGIGVLSPERQREITDKIALLTFGQHLVQARPLIPERGAQIAEEVNRARDAFVHFKRARFEPPHYEGQPVLEDPGFRACMDVVREFLFLVPFRMPGWSANP